MNAKVFHTATLAMVLALHATGVWWLSSTRPEGSTTPPSVASMEMLTIAAPSPSPGATAVRQVAKVAPMAPKPPTPAKPRSTPAPAVRPTAAPQSTSTTASPVTGAATATAQSTTAATGPATATAAAAAVSSSPPVFSAAYLNNPRPTYPAMSRDLGETGKVLLKVVVSHEGRATDITLARSSGYPRLDRAASEAVRTWRFTPAKHGDQAVTESVIVPVVFSLQS